MPQARAASETTMNRVQEFLMWSQRRKNHASENANIDLVAPRGADGSKLAVSVCTRVASVQPSTNSRQVLSEGRPVP